MCLEKNGWAGWGPQVNRTCGQGSGHGSSVLRAYPPCKAFSGPYTMGTFPSLCLWSWVYSLYCLLAGSELTWSERNLRLKFKSSPHQFPKQAWSLQWDPAHSLSSELAVFSFLSMTLSCSKHMSSCFSSHLSCGKRTHSFSWFFIQYSLSTYYVRGVKYCTRQAGLLLL